MTCLIGAFSPHVAVAAGLMRAPMTANDAAATIAPTTSVLFTVFPLAVATAAGLPVGRQHYASAQGPATQTDARAGPARPEARRRQAAPRRTKPMRSYICASVGLETARASSAPAASRRASSASSPRYSW